MFLSVDTLTSIIGIGLPILVELINLLNCYNFCISNDLTQMVNFLPWIPDCDSHSPALLDLFGNSDHVDVRVSIDFSSNSQWNALFHHMTYDYSHADSDGLCDHLRDVSWDDIFKLGASAAAREFCEWVQVGIDVYIPLRKYQVRPYSFPWFPAPFATAIVHRNHSLFLPKR